MKRVFFAFVIGGCCLLASPVFSQELTTVGDEALVSMSGEERVALAQDYISRIEGVLSTGSSLLEEARKKEDVSGIACINEKMVAVKGFLNVAQNSSANLSDAVNRKDDAAGLHHIKLCNLASVRSSVLGNEMLTCMGANVDYTGPTKLEVSRKCAVEPCLSGEQLTSPESDLIRRVEADASPYR